jgi:chloramphenicol 3-O phosphotransferase
MDAFLDMMPARYWDYPDGVTFETVQQDGSHRSSSDGPGGGADPARHAPSIAAMAREGNNLIVDDVLENEMRTGSAAGGFYIPHCRCVRAA